MNLNCRSCRTSIPRKRRDNLVVSLLLSLVSTLVFSRTGGVLFHLNSLTPRSWDTRPRTPLVSFCIVQLRTLCAAQSLATLCLSTISSPGPGELLGFWGFMVFRHASIPRKGSGNQKQQQQNLLKMNQLKCNFK